MTTFSNMIRKSDRDGERAELRVSGTICMVKE